MLAYLKCKAVTAVCDDVALSVALGFRYACTLTVQYVAFGADAPRLDTTGHTLTLCLRVLTSTLALWSPVLRPLAVLCVTLQS